MFLSSPSTPATADTTDTLCHILARVLAIRSPTAEGWVLWAPHTPLATSLDVLGLTPYADSTWSLLVQRGWIEQHANPHSLAFRLTPLGQQMAHTSPPSLSMTPSWFQAVLHHLTPPPPR